MGVKIKIVNKFLKNIVLFFLLLGQVFWACRQAPQNENYKAKEPTILQEEKAQNAEKTDDNSSFKKHRKGHKGKQNPEHFSNKSTDNQRVINSDIPQKVYGVLKYVRQNNAAPDGYVGGRKFGNFENLLPKKDTNNRRIIYQEWDVNPKISGRNRGTERLITGSDGKAYFTNNHYKSFTEVIEK